MGNNTQNYLIIAVVEDQSQAPRAAATKYLLIIDLLARGISMRNDRAKTTNTTASELLIAAALGSVSVGSLASIVHSGFQSVQSKEEC